MIKIRNFYILVILGTFMISLLNPTSIQAKIIPELSPSEMYLTFFSLPDGEATLLQVKEGPTVLINTGSQKSESSLLSQLEEFSLSKIDTLIMTKQTMDYCGNAHRLIERFTIDTFAYAGQLTESCDQQTSLSTIEKEKWNSGELKKLHENLVFKVLKAEDNGEMSLAITYGETSIMYLSNSSVEDEKDLLNYPVDPKIIKIGDYGKGNSPSSAFLSEIDPHMSIVFNCEDCVSNEGLIERLNESWIDVYELARVGTTIIRMNLEKYEVIS